MENIFENALDYVRHLDQIDNGWSESEKTLASAMMSYAAKVVKNNAVLPLVSERTLGINSCAALIKSMPTDQAIQIMKSDITGQPQTTVIDGELVVTYVR